MLLFDTDGSEPNPEMSTTIRELLQELK